MKSSRRIVGLASDEAFRELKKLGSEVPVIISSGSAEQEVEQDSGFDHGKIYIEGSSFF